VLLDLDGVGSAEHGRKVPASPRPFSVPFQCAAAETVDAGALRAGCGVGLTPEVLESVSDLFCTFHRSLHTL
jgi:hypothetical protein